MIVSSLRRFDDVLHYSKPTKDEIKQLISMRICGYSNTVYVGDEPITVASGLSQAEIVKACDDAIKDCLISGKKLSEQMLVASLKERTEVYISRRA